MNSTGRLVIGLAATIFAIVGCYMLLMNGVYGFTLLVFLPIFIGAVGAWVFPRRRMELAVRDGVIAVMLSTLGLFALGWEGAICIVMSWPMVLPLGAFGAAAMHFATRRSLGGQSIAGLLLLAPATLTVDITAVPPSHAVRTSIEIAATPEVVWKHVVSFSEIPQPDEWYFKTGLAYPLRARIDGAGPGAVRYCEFSTGPFVEPIEVWDEPNLLRFSVIENPAPMEEWSPYAALAPRHLHGYFISDRGQFQLKPLGDSHVLLEGTTWYRHHLGPSFYWQWWSDAIIHRIHGRVLEHIQSLSEAEMANR
jgi:hypothetical protein